MEYGWAGIAREMINPYSSQYTVRWPYYIRKRTPRSFDTDIALIVNAIDQAHKMAMGLRERHQPAKMCLLDSTT